ncbi:MAG: metal-sensing transcriptional repressor [Clostridia bacterium]|nr:metal-sensing transcriptional repressor [Clostridia bacterium]
MAENQTAPCCSARKKHRDEEEKRQLIKRLKLAEGQIRGIQRMIEDDAYCPDVLIQVSAVTNALKSFSRELLSEHMRTCLMEDIRGGNDSSIDELLGVIQKLMK